jgi:hypothetical protein
MAFEKSLLISVYNRDKPIRTLPEFNYYLSLLSNPKFFSLVPEGLCTNVLNVRQGVGCLYNEIPPQSRNLGVFLRH